MLLEKAQELTKSIHASEYGEFKVYIHYLRLKNKAYIGQTKQQNPNKRWKNGKKYQFNQYFTNAIKKYGWNAFDHSILIDNISESEANKLETFFIEALQTNTKKFGYNLSNGGGNRTMLKSTRDKLSKIAKERKVSESTKKAISEGLKKYYKNHPRPFQPLSDITKKNISKGIRKYYKDPNTRKKQGEAIKKSYKENPERKEKLRKIFSGENAPFYGRHHTEENKKIFREKALKRPHRKHSEKTKTVLREKNLGKNNPMYGKKLETNPNSKAVYGIQIKTKRRVDFKTVKEASEYLNLTNHSSISNCLNKRTRSSGGYYWFYL